MELVIFLSYTAGIEYSGDTSVSIPLAYLRSFGNVRLDLTSDDIPSHSFPQNESSLWLIYNAWLVDR
jgi:hypothetical protein